MSVQAPSSSPGYLVAKRSLDVALASAGLVLTLPVTLLVAAAIKLEDGGSIFFRQVRLGRDACRFRVWKFRTMPEDPERVPEQGHPSDDDLTRVGRLIRPTALDELPQLWNIMKGEMSFVGPRADVPAEQVAGGDGETVSLTDLPGYDERLSVRPGLTGLAQIELPRDASHEEKLERDLEYVRNRTLWLDLRLIARSIVISLTARWPDVGS